MSTNNKQNEPRKVKTEKELLDELLVLPYPWWQMLLAQGFYMVVIFCFFFWFFVGVMRK